MSFSSHSSSGESDQQRQPQRPSSPTLYLLLKDAQHPEPPLNQEEQQLLEEGRLHTLDSLEKLFEREINDDSGSSLRTQQHKSQQSTGIVSWVQPSSDDPSVLVEHRALLDPFYTLGSTEDQRKAPQEPSSGPVRSSRLISLRQAMRSVGFVSKYRDLILQMEDEHHKRDHQRQCQCHCHLKKQEDQHD